MRKQACLRNFFVSRFVFLFVKLIKTVTVCLTRTVYKYDNNNNLVEEITSYGSRTFYKYDNRNNLIEETFKDGSKITYKYDEKGNWIEKRQNNFLTERIIEYY